MNMHARASNTWFKWTAAAFVMATVVAAAMVASRYVGAATTNTITTLAGSATSYKLDPITSSGSAPPIVMLTLSRDHQLHLKAYNDYSDLNGDGTVELTYSGAILYYGYFDPKKCYTYGSGYFSPSESATISTDSKGKQTTVYCNQGKTTNEWSGNFLNWGTMTRMDVVRKLLYGGLRSTDTATQTILERDYLPTDAHAFAKYYNGTDVASLTPFTTNTSSPTTTYTFAGITAPTPAAGAALSGSSVSSTDPTVNPKGVKYSKVSFDASGISGVAIGDQVQIQSSSGTGGPIIQGTIHDLSSNTATVWILPGTAPPSTSGGWTGSGSITSATITDLSLTGITLCNMTVGAFNSTSVNHLSHTNTNPPLIRVANGNYQFWGTSEKWQCYWSGEKSKTQEGFNAGILSNGNRVPYSGLLASAENPDQGARALGTGDTGGASSAAGQFIARVAACVPGLIGSERCKTYPTTNTTYTSGVQKPIGLLQVYGETNLMSIGLLTPSYQKNVSGGVLRKNVGTFGDEVNTTTDGTYNSLKGIVYNINHLRQYGYDYNNDDNYAWNGCPYQQTGIAVGTGGSGTVVNEGKCASWGNPMGEAYVEGLRYFAGLTATSAFGASSSTGPDADLGLSVASWTDPVQSTNYCASLNQLVFNSSVSSYDDDQAVTPFAGLFGSPDLNAWTNKVGDGEGITGAATVKNYLIGSNGTVSDQLCSSKAINTLSTVSGLCPEAPVLHGSFLIDGAAYYSHTNRIRDGSLLSVPTTDTTSLKVTTYGVALATNVPKITVAVPGSTTSQKVVIQPAFRLTLPSPSTGTGQGTLVDFKPITLAADGSSGSYYVNWEDSTQGGDFDQDVWGILSYTVTSSSITVTTKVISQSTANPQGFGYVISGTTTDGVHFHSGILNFNFTDTSGVTGCVNCNVADSATSVTYSFSGGAASSFNDPLWYAAKYGGFIDYDKDGTPLDTNTTYPNREWDSFNQNGTANPAGDGIPDNYYFVTNPAALETSLQAAFQAILGRTASGTAAAVVANQREGDGATYQALYEGTRSDVNGASVSWLGTVQGLFVDTEGNLREDDAAHDATLHPSDFTAAGNPAVKIVYDTASNTTEFRRYNCDPSAGCTTFTIDALDTLNTIWNARVQLANMTLTSPSAPTSPRVTSNRTYTSLANTGRYIFTFIDKNLNGKVDSGEQVAFDISSFSGTGINYYGILNAADTTSATNLVSYIRGQDVTGLRNRSIDYGTVNGTDAGTKSYILGDVVDSTPAVVGTPAEAFDLLYKDLSYAAFRATYQRRRNVAYVGANDGMLHAFNAGFYNAQLTKFELTGARSEPQHPLGSELWAYVPFNLLPHLVWLTDAKYAHVFYFDGAPRVFDAHIFSDTSNCTPASDTTPQNCHPYGWATIMVVGMRFGGGDLSLPACITLLTASQFTSFTGLDCTKVSNITTHSAYAVLDVTNPEEPPVVLAEVTGITPLTATNVLGYTTSFPSAMAFSTRGNGTSATTLPSGDNWYFLFGNGPGNLTDAGSTQNAKLYVYQLNSASAPAGTGCPTASAGICDSFDLGGTDKRSTVATTAAANSFVGDPIAVDWQLRFAADDAYFGIATGTGAGTATDTGASANLRPGGLLVKVDTGGSATAAGSPNTSKWKLSTLANPGLPILSAPSATFDPSGNHWIYAGTGRLYVTGDKATTAITVSPTQAAGGEQQALFGVIENGATVPDYTTLTDVTNAAAKVSDQTIVPDTTAATPTSVTETALESTVQGKLGWKITLNTPASGSTDVSERVLSSTAVLAGTLFASAYTPNTGLCLGPGSSRLFALNYLTGVANPTNPALGINPSSTTYYANSVTLGPGLAAAPSLHADTTSGANGLVTVVTQTSTGSISLNNAQVSPKSKSAEIDWRQTHPGTGP